MLLEPEDVGLWVPPLAGVGEDVQRCIEADVRGILKPIPFLAW